MSLRIPRELLEELRQHGEQTYPHECCGVLVGNFAAEGKLVRSVVRCGNARDDSPRDRYQISPADLFRIQKAAAVSEQDIVGFYHSHPDHPAAWSSTDLAEAHWTGCSYVITGVEQGRAQQTRSFSLTGLEDEKHFENEDIELA